MELTLRYRFVKNASNANYICDIFGGICLEFLFRSSFDYLLKPYEDTRVIKLFSDLMKILEEKEPELEISVSRQRMKIPFGKIHSVTSQNHSVNLTTEDGVYHSAATFSSMQTCLCEDARFLVCNRGIIVNMDFILKFDKDCIKMLNGTVFPVRQKDKSKLL